MPPKRSLKDRQLSSKRGRPPTIGCNRKSKKNDAASKSAESGHMQRKRAKPPVISLDVTFSSSSETDSDIEEEVISPFQLILSNETMGSSVNNLMSPSKKSDSSDSSDYEVSGFSPFKNTNKNNSETFDDECDIEDCSDLYGSNYEAERLQAFKILQDTLKTRHKTNNSLIESSTDDILNVQNNIDISDSSLNDISASLDVSSVYVKPPAKPRQTKKGKEALQSLKSFSQRFHQDIKSTPSDLEISTDDIIFVDNEESSEINIKIRWGMSYIKIPIQKEKKFLVLYQQLAEKYNVSVNDVVLSFQDRVLSPELRLVDSGLSVADIIEGGLINKKRKESSMESPIEGKDLITLKIQSSTKNDSTTLTMSKYDKMLILMQNYATSKMLSLDTLKFQFDGETINPNDIAFELELEGGECIDVFHI